MVDNIITKNQPKPQVHVKCSYCGENISTKGKKNKSVGQGANFPHVSNLVKKIIFKWLLILKQKFFFSSL